MRAAEAGTPAVSPDLATFKQRFDLFTSGQLDGLDWSNVFVAGGAVLAALSPIPDEYAVSKRKMREWYNGTGRFLGYSPVTGGGPFR